MRRVSWLLDSPSGPNFSSSFEQVTYTKLYKKPYTTNKSLSIEKLASLATLELGSNLPSASQFPTRT